MKLYKCLNCGSIFKITKTEENKIYTDMNGMMEFKDDHATCLCCKHSSKFNHMNTEDWIATLLFTVKGH